METVVKIIIPIFSVLVMLAIPFLVVLYGGNLWRGVIAGWISSVVWISILAFPIYNWVWSIDKELTKNLPEAKSVIGAIMMGWFVSMLVGFVALYIRKLVMRYKPEFLFRTNPKG